MCQEASSQAGSGWATGLLWSIAGANGRIILGYSTLTSRFQFDRTECI
jgi:hypothetical protein